MATLSTNDLFQAGFTKDQVEKIVGIAAMASNTHEADLNPVIPDAKPKITTLQDLRTYAEGTVVRFPDFAEGQPLVAKVRRPSLLMLASEGKIPNSLLSAAGELFSKGNSALDNDSTQMLKDTYSICKIMADATFVSPTLAEIEGAGLTLTDEQLMAVFSYTQAGVKALENFR